MTTQISITITCGSASVTDEDRERAEAAAIKVLGDVSPAAAYAEYLRQWAEYDDEAPMTGLAALWADAAKAANTALTEGWFRRGNAACEIAA